MQSLISTALITGVLLTTLVNPSTVHAQDSTDNQNSRIESQLRSSVNPQACYYIAGAWKVCY
ncbi:MAG: hypothetical protein VKL42_11315 [Snowella sp.]|nr:hypothetical protein [Snowella sp.]